MDRCCGRGQGHWSMYVIRAGGKGGTIPFSHPTNLVTNESVIHPTHPIAAIITWVITSLIPSIIPPITQPVKEVSQCKCVGQKIKQVCQCSNSINHIETFTVSTDAWRRKTGALSVHAGIQQSEQHCGQTAGGTALWDGAAQPSPWGLSSVSCSTCEVHLLLFYTNTHTPSVCVCVRAGAQEE